MRSWILATHIFSSLYGLHLHGVLGAVDPTQLQQHLASGVGILGALHYTTIFLFNTLTGSAPGNYTTQGRLTDWMAVLDDSEPLQTLNLPGTHDSCACT